MHASESHVCMTESSCMGPKLTCILLCLQLCMCTTLPCMRVILHAEP